jgi:hypothetical protein
MVIVRVRSKHHTRHDGDKAARPEPAFRTRTEQFSAESEQVAVPRLKVDEESGLR